MMSQRTVVFPFLMTATQDLQNFVQPSLQSPKNYPLSRFSHHQMQHQMHRAFLKPEGLCSQMKKVPVRSPSFEGHATPNTTKSVATRNRAKKRRLYNEEESEISSIRSNKKVKGDPIPIQNSIKAALNKQNKCEDLVGDFSHGHRLLTIKGKHQDLKIRLT